MVSAAQFIANAEQIAAEEPRYQHGHYGQDGFCDCIGLIIGAIRRAGGQWRGLHGSNYAARYEVHSLEPIAGSSQLSPGEVVFKAYEPGQGGYGLPASYEHGGGSYNGDLRDYYHIGIVESVYPLRIRHMTTPKIKMDTSIGKWSFHGKLKKIDYSGGGGKVEQVIISGGNPDAPINLRAAASTSSSLIAQIPQGSTAELIEGGGTWNQIRYGKHTGYVKSEFVHKDSEGEKIQVSRADLEKVYDILGDMLGLRG